MTSEKITSRARARQLADKAFQPSARAKAAARCLISRGGAGTRTPGRHLLVALGEALTVAKGERTTDLTDADYRAPAALAPASGSGAGVHRRSGAELATRWALR